MKCSFEETVEILMDAAIYNEVDQMRSVSENIIFGQMVPVGTGAFDLHMDDERSRGEDGELGTCALDNARPVFNTSKKDEMFGFNTPMGPASVSPYREYTPHDSEDKIDVAMSTGGTYAEDQTPEVTPASEFGAGISPFSPTAAAARESPFSPSGASPQSEYSPGTNYSSPASNFEFTPASPSYSPAAEEKDNEKYGSLSPTYSPRSVAYTPSGSTLHYEAKKPESRSGLRSTGTVSAGGKSTPGTSPAWSPSYSPSAPASAFYSAAHPGVMTSPAYTPMSHQYGAPTSPLYTPTSPMRTDKSPGYASTHAASAAYSPTVGGGPSPVIQAGARATSPGYADDDVLTSPSYTPQEANIPEASDDVVYSAGIDDLQEDAQSELFEPSDDEDMYYEPPAGPTG